jgi:hypothetical protein
MVRWENTTAVTGKVFHPASNFAKDALATTKRLATPCLHSNAVVDRLGVWDGLGAPKPGIRTWQDEVNSSLPALLELDS